VERALIKITRRSELGATPVQNQDRYLGPQKKTGPGGVHRKKNRLGAKLKRRVGDLAGLRREKKRRASGKRRCRGIPGLHQGGLARAAFKGHSKFKKNGGGKKKALKRGVRKEPLVSTNRGGRGGGCTGEKTS